MYTLLLLSHSSCNLTDCRVYIIVGAVFQLMPTHSVNDNYVYRTIVESAAMECKIIIIILVVFVAMVTDYE